MTKHLHAGKPLERARHVDVRVEYHGSLYLMRLLTPAADEWVENNVHEPTFYAGALVVEPRYAGELLAGMRGDGLVAQ